SAAGCARGRTAGRGNRSRAAVAAQPLVDPGDSVAVRPCRHVVHLALFQRVGGARPRADEPAKRVGRAGTVLQLLRARARRAARPLSPGSTGRGPARRPAERAAGPGPPPPAPQPAVNVTPDAPFADTPLQLLPTAAAHVGAPIIPIGPALPMPPPPGVNDP